MRRRQPEVASMTAEEKAISEKEKRERRNKRRRERYAERKKDPAETEKMSKLQAERYMRFVFSFLQYKNKLRNI